MGTFKNQVLWRGSLKPDPAIADVDAIVAPYFATGTTTGTGALSVTLSPSLTGLLLVLTHLNSYSANAIAAGYGVQYVTHDGVVYHVQIFSPIAALVSLTWDGKMVLDASDTITVSYSALATGNTIYFFAQGYTIPIY